MTRPYPNFLFLGQELEKTLAPSWYERGRMRQTGRHPAKPRGGQAVAQLRTELDELGPKRSLARNCRLSLTGADSFIATTKTLPKRWRALSRDWHPGIARFYCARSNREFAGRQI